MISTQREDWKRCYISLSFSFKVSGACFLHKLPVQSAGLEFLQFYNFTIFGSIPDQTFELWDMNEGRMNEGCEVSAVIICISIIWVGHYYFCRIHVFCYLSKYTSWIQYSYNLKRVTFQNINFEKYSFMYSCSFSNIWKWLPMRSNAQKCKILKYL